jgi:hypothetical protein
LQQAYDLDVAQQQAGSEFERIPQREAEPIRTAAE